MIPTVDDLADAERIGHEIKLLHFDHETVITVLDLLPPLLMSHFEHVFSVADLMETDVHRITYSK